MLLRRRLQGSTIRACCANRLSYGRVAAVGADSSSSTDGADGDSTHRMTCGEQHVDSVVAVEIVRCGAPTSRFNGPSRPGTLSQPPLRFAQRASARIRARPRSPRPRDIRIPRWSDVRPRIIQHSGNATFDVAVQRPRVCAPKAAQSASRLPQSRVASPASGACGRGSHPLCMVLVAESLPVA